MKLSTNKTTNLINDLNDLTDVISRFDANWKDFINTSDPELFEKLEDYQRFMEASARFEEKLDSLCN